MKSVLKITVMLLLLAIPLWRGRNFLHRQYREIDGICATKFGEALVNAHLERSPLARSFFTDFAQLDRYQAANRALPPIANGRVVFLGDSIVDFWPTAFSKQFFPGRHYIGRGISGQSTPEMVWRLEPDVIDLHPATLVLLAGTNDVVQPYRFISVHETEENVKTMVELARQHYIRVILCSIPPVANFPEPKQSTFSAHIKTLNQWLQTYAAQQHLTYVDLYAAMSTPSGSMQPSLSKDGVHPNAAGYELMRSLTQQAIDGVTDTAATPRLTSR